MLKIATPCSTARLLQALDPLSDKFYGDRAGSISDPFGQRWSIMTHKEDLSAEEMEKRMSSAASTG